MPELRAFRGIRYSAADKLADVVCPPYDVISPQEQITLHDRSPHNAVRVELPFSEGHDATERYRRAGRQFRAWLDEGVLVAEREAALYVYRQDFVWQGARKRIAGVIGALRLEEFGPKSGILPHERTMPGPIEDRLALLRACPVNISPIYGIYRGAGGLAPFFDALSHRPTDARVADEHNTLHRLWVIRAPAEIEMLTAAAGAGDIVIADGHHRFETALAHHKEKGTEPGQHDAVMCFCADADVEDLNVLPYHRAVVASVEPEEVCARLVEVFEAKEVEYDVAQRVLEHSAADHSFIVLVGDRRFLLEVHEDQVTAAVGDEPVAWRSLDVVALHEAVLPQLVPEGIEELRFSSDEDEIDRLVKKESWTAGFLLRPLDAVQVVEVARAAMRMPQKASYFWPKALTGLVFRSLD